MNSIEIRSNLFLRLLTVAAILAGAPARAQGPAAPEPLWQVDHGEVYCTLGRNYGPDATSFAIRAVPGTSITELLLTNPRWRETPMYAGQRGRIVLTPGAEPIESTALTTRLADGGRVLAFFYLGGEFVDRFAQATQLRVLRGDRTMIALDYPQARQVVAAFRECLSRTLRDWGIDAAAQARFRSLPRLANRPFSDSDYPGAALRADMQGVAIARVTIGTDGRASECRIVRSTGSPSLDARTCEVFERDGRFTPAVGPDGQPVAAGMVVRTLWRLVG
jgi:TonB family protein